MRIYLKPAEVKELQKAGEILTKDQLIEKMKAKGEDISEGLIVRYLDYRNNPMAPESFAYSVSYKHTFLEGKRIQGILWPNSVGLQ